MQWPHAFKDTPPGLPYLCLTQAWERFSFYGMRALLVLYLTSELLLPERSGSVIGLATLRDALQWIFGPLSVQALSSQIYGLYVALVYLTPLFGGILADRLTGQRNAVLVGGILIAAGHFLMACDRTFLFALLFIVIGSGCFTPNIAALVGNLYPQGDLRRDRAFSLFYVGVQLGAFASPLVCGLVGEVYGWHYGFSLAGVGMIAGLVTFVRGRKYLSGNSAQGGIPPATAAAPRIGPGRIGAGIVVLVSLGTLFWAAYEQVGNVLNLWLLNETDRSVFGWFEMKTSTLQAVNPLLIIVLTPLLMAFWTALDRRGIRPSSFSKMTSGFLLLGAGFLILGIASMTAGPHERVSLLWTLGFLLALTLGELLFAPTSWALFSRVGSSRMASSMMGIWYLSLFGGGYIAGYLGTFWERLPRAGFWSLIAAVAVCGGIGIWLMRNQLQRWLEVDDETRGVLPVRRAGAGGTGQA